MLLHYLQFFEERREMDNTAATDKIGTVGIDETGGENVELIFDSVGDNGMACIVSACKTTA